MSKKFKDLNGGGFVMMHKGDRIKLLGHLENASKSVRDAMHPVHGHILKAANVIGAIEDRSEDDSSDAGNLTSPGTRTDLSSRPGKDTSIGTARDSTEIAARAAGSAQDLIKTAGGNVATFEIMRKAAVLGLYKSAAKETSRVKQAALERFAYELDLIEARNLGAPNGGIEKSVVGSHRGRNRSFAERHGI
jgi:hypothetical protein